MLPGASVYLVIYILFIMYGYSHYNILVGTLAEDYSSISSVSTVKMRYSWLSSLLSPNSGISAEEESSLQ